MKAYVSPVDVEVEAAVLGCMLTSPKDAATCIIQLTLDAFSFETEQQLFAALARLHIAGARRITDYVQGLEATPYKDTDRTLLDIVGYPALLSMVDRALDPGSLGARITYLKQSAELRALCPVVTGKATPYATAHVGLAAYAVICGGEFEGVHTLAGQRMHVFRVPWGKSVEQLLQEAMSDVPVSAGQFSSTVEALLMLQPGGKIADIKREE